MILVGSQRGGARQLAAHLLNDRENDHVTLLDLRGFVGASLGEALDEAHAIARGTRAKQFLFSLSFNPPKGGEASIADLIAAADRAEAALGLDGQPRAMILHEKKGRMHLHAVWSRIDATALRAIPMPFFKNRLNALSRELYLEHGWELPEGYRTNGWKSPLNFTLAEWQQAERLGIDPRELKQMVQDAWRHSDNRASFRRAMEEHGYFLARGDRRGFVVVDLNGEVFALARLAGLRTKEIDARFGDTGTLPGVDDVKAKLERQLNDRLRAVLEDGRAAQAAEMAPLRDERGAMVRMQRRERAVLKTAQHERRTEEMKARAARYRKGLRGFWDILTGRMAAIRHDNERDVARCGQRDRNQFETVCAHQATDRRLLQARMEALRTRQREDRQHLIRQIAQVLRLTEPGSRAGPGRPRPRDLDLGL